jgi:hypothetical protein
MKKITCTILILIMSIFLINPLSSEARGGHGGSGWWLPWAILGGAAIVTAPYYSRHYEPAPVIIREQTPVYIQPSPSVTPSTTDKVFVYPRQGQNEDLQAKDRYECHSWAVNQTHYDPTQSSIGDMTETQRTQMRSEYQRAMGACLDGRGYTMR